MVLFALEKHYLAVNDLEFVERLYTPLIKPAADLADIVTAAPVFRSTAMTCGRSVAAFSLTPCVRFGPDCGSGAFAKLFGTS